MFLVQMSLDVKKAEILKLDARAKDKEEAGADVTWCDPVVSCGAPQLCFSVVYPLFPKNIHRHVIGVMFTNFTNLDNERFCCPLQLSFPKLPVVLSFGMIVMWQTQCHSHQAHVECSMIQFSNSTIIHNNSEECISWFMKLGRRKKTPGMGGMKTHYPWFIHEASTNYPLQLT